MTFEQWLRQIGKSERTAKSYSGAVSGKITEWANEAGLISESLLDIYADSIYLHYLTLKHAPLS